MNLGIIGCGKMGSALVKGAIKENAIDGQKVMVIDLVPELAQKLSNDIEATVAKTNDDLIKNSDAILLCVKPQDMISLGIVAYGRDHAADISVAELAFY